MNALLQMPFEHQRRVGGVNWASSVGGSLESRGAIGDSVAMPTDRLTMTVIRLMTIAIGAMGDAPDGYAALGPKMPGGFHAWPCHEMDVVGASATRLRCYVSPSILVDGERGTFPLGTKFVVERVVARGGARRQDTSRRWRCVSCFVMNKYATVTMPHGGERELWAHALYVGAQIQSARPLWGVRRVDA